MNILLVTMEMNIGGAETHVLELAKALKKQENVIIFRRELQRFRYP